MVEEIIKVVLKNDKGLGGVGSLFWWIVGFSMWEIDKYRFVKK